MSIIDTQNAKTIRDPMVVSVTLDARESATISASIRGTAPAINKTAAIREPYPLRAVADLKLDGFPLDGSRVLVDTSAQESSANGKLSVRTHIGEDVALNISSTTTIRNLTVSAANCSEVVNNTIHYDMSNGSAIIPVNGPVAIVFFLNATDNDRIEIGSVVPGVRLSYTNDELISCEVNLRSDLSPIDPSLPESEIEIRAYERQDVSDIMSTVMEDQPILYSAGYASDMSTTRKFYLSEPAQWSDNCLTLKGVDAVHNLDAEIPADIFIGMLDYSGTTTPDVRRKRRVSYLDSQRGAFVKLYAAAYGMLSGQQSVSDVTLEEYDPAVTLESFEAYPPASAESYIEGKWTRSYFEKQSRRDIIANLMNLCRMDFPSGMFNGINAFYINYVDAGIPALSWSKPTSKWDIYEADCGDITRHVDRKIVEIDADNKNVRCMMYWDEDLIGNPPYYNAKNVTQVGSLDIFKNDGAVLNIDAPTTICAAWYKADTATAYMGIDSSGVGPHWARQRVAAFRNNVPTYWGVWAYTENAFIDWVDYMDGFWDLLVLDRVASRDDDQANLVVYGNAYKLTDAPKKYTRDGVGITVNPSKTKWYGIINAGRYDTGNRTQILPNRGFEQLLQRSNETGSFTWKGDPRMQPRDVFTFHKLDGTTELRTIETISLKHEGGGTVAEITYRKGVV